jgi:hypothetical protein
MPGRNISAWQWVGNDVLAALRRYPGKCLTSSQIIAIVVASINPAAFAESVRNEKARELARVFSEAYASEPELTYSIIGAVRAKWNDTGYIAARVHKRMTTEVWNTRPSLGLPGQLTCEAKAAAFLESNETANSLGAIKIARRRLPKSPGTLLISEALHSALHELKLRGFDVGDGNASPPQNVR